MASASHIKEMESRPPRHEADENPWRRPTFDELAKRNLARIYASLPAGRA
jgi:hypothetical protein